MPRAENGGLRAFSVAGIGLVWQFPPNITLFADGTRVDLPLPQSTAVKVRDGESTASMGMCIMATPARGCLQIRNGMGFITRELPWTAPQNLTPPGI